MWGNSQKSRNNRLPVRLPCDISRISPFTCVPPVSRIGFSKRMRRDRHIQYPYSLDYQACGRLSPTKSRLICPFQRLLHCDRAWRWNGGGASPTLSFGIFLDSRQIGMQCWQVFAQDLPDDLDVNAKVIVHYSVSEPDDLVPFQAGMFFLEIIRQPT